MNLSSQPIGIFDSGVGGLTVMKELIAALPREKMIYFADTANMPYGDKSSDQIIEYSRAAVQFLLKKNVKMIVVACNTSSAHALKHLKLQTSIPIIELIEGGVKQAINQTKNYHIALIGTKKTIESQVYQKAFFHHIPHISLYPIACPRLVPLIESQQIHHASMHLIIKEYLHSLPKNKIDTLVMGCTHYPFLKDIIQQEMGQHVSLINPAISCVKEVVEVLNASAVCALKANNEHEFYTSAASHRFHIIAQHFLGVLIKKVTQI